MWNLYEAASASEKRTCGEAFSKEGYARGQVDLIDMQSCKDGEFKFIMNYQDYLTKFVVLRALKSKTAAEVWDNLIDIFCSFGASAILQSDNGREFCE